MGGRSGGVFSITVKEYLLFYFKISIVYVCQTPTRLHTHTTLHTSLYSEAVTDVFVNTEAVHH